MNRRHFKSLHDDGASESAIREFSEVMSQDGGVFVGRIGRSDFEAVAFSESPWRHRALLPKSASGKLIGAASRTPYAHLTFRGHQKRVRELNGFFSTSQSSEDFREYLRILDSAYSSTQYFTYATRNLQLLINGSSAEPAFSHYAHKVTSNKTLWNYTFIESLRPFVDSMGSWFTEKRILVVSPFAESVSAQWGKRQDLHAPGILLPPADLQTYATPITYSSFSPREKPPRFARTDSWVSELELMFEEISTLDFDVALLGCSSYGMALGPRLEAAGKKAVYVGGAVNLLFNIFGERFSSPYYESLVNLNSRIDAIEQRKYFGSEDGRKFKNEAMNAYFRTPGNESNRR